MHIIALGHAGGYPFRHGVFASHAFSEIPEGGTAGEGCFALSVDDEVDFFVGGESGAIAEEVVGRADDKKRGGWGQPAVAGEKLDEHVAIGLVGPVFVACLVGAVGQNNQARRTAAVVFGEDRFFPLEPDVGLCAIETEHIVGEAARIFGDPAEEPDLPAAARAC